MAIVGWQLYVDETGTHGGAKLRGCAGYVARERHWDGFVRDWYAMLPPKLRERGFHFKDFAAQIRGGFRDPGDLRPLVRVIQDYLTYGVGCAVNMDAYRALSGKRKALVPHVHGLCLLLVPSL